MHTPLRIFLSARKFIRGSKKIDSRYIRIVLHFIFWMLIYQFFIYLKKPLLGLPYYQAALVELKDLIAVALIFYFLSYYVVPEFFAKKRFIHLFVSLMLCYYFYATVSFLEFTFFPDLITIPGRGYQVYSQRILSAGLLGILRLDNFAEILLDLSYLISPALMVKFFLTLLNLNTQALKLERDNLNLELAFLKAQINPHFLFNTLNNVYSLALHKSASTADIVLKLSELMRYTLYDSNTAYVPLAKEIHFYNNYIELERIRHTSRVTISRKINNNHSDHSIAPLMVFPFIENAFKHGINTSVNDSWVTIELEEQNSILNFRISNSRFPVKLNEKQVGGIGIANTKKRLNLLYPNAYTLAIEETEAAFSVKLEIKLRKI